MMVSDPLLRRDKLRVVGVSWRSASGQSAKQAGVSFCGSSGELTGKLGFMGQYAAGIFFGGKSSQPPVIKTPRGSLPLQTAMSSRVKGPAFCLISLLL